MIEYIKGQVTQLTPTYAVIETGGIGYLANITLSTFSSLENVGETKLLIHEVIREDAHTLFGFLTEQERTLFRQLIGVSGVGPNTARMILSSITGAELESVIVNGDSKRLKNVKGVGAKTAERIIVDLRDKIKPTDVTLIMQPMANTEVFDEALAALLMLGFSAAQSRKALSKIFESDPATKVESAIKKALSML